MESLRTETIQTHKQRDVFITRTAIKTLTSEATVEKVINFQFRKMAEAFKKFSTVELSGFGKFYISQAKLRRRIANLVGAKETYETQLLNSTDEEKSMLLEEKIEKLSRIIEYLNQRLNETKESTGRMEKSPVPTGEDQGPDRGSI